MAQRPWMTSFSRKLRAQSVSKQEGIRKHYMMRQWQKIDAPSQQLGVAPEAQRVEACCAPGRASNTADWRANTRDM